jgi:tryptophan-rich sensory protein
MTFTVRLLIFLLVNFGALYVGSILQGPGPMGDWYQSLQQAPWSPPGYVFGIAWTSIMLCFSVYMAFATPVKGDTVLLGLFVFQFILNVLWNPIFFKHQMTGLAMITIVSLLIVVSALCYKYRKSLGLKSLLIAPYIVWLVIACSLNAYILINN